MTLTRRALGATALATILAFPALAQDKGTIGIAMPTKSSARWIADGDNMVKQFEEAGYATDLQYAEDDIPNQLAQIENMITKGVDALVIAAIGLAMAHRPGSLGATFVFAALMMRILATAVSIGNPNDEARISNVLGLGMWTLPALVVAILLWMMVLAARRSETGPKWFVVSWIGASIGFTGVVFGERFLPAIPV